MSLLPSLSGLLLPGLLKALFLSLNVSIDDRQFEKNRRDGSCLFTFWHGKMICGWLLARHLFADRNIHAVISLSSDGEILSRTLHGLGFSLIRGSSSRGSDNVKESMNRELDKKGIVAITPDGPRGPLHSFKYGTLRLASQRGIPIIFASIHYSKAITLKSWDHFEIPLPFSRVNIALHRIEVPAMKDQDELAAYEQRLSKHLAHDRNGNDNP